MRPLLPVHATDAQPRLEEFARRLQPPPSAWNSRTMTLRADVPDSTFVRTSGAGRVC